jgi:hypothetical protein
MKHEQDQRLGILNTLLRTPHRRLDELWPIHEELARHDPRFYVHLAAWYFVKGEVRDHKEMFVVALLLSDFEGHRDVGLALLRSMPPYQVVRVVDFIHGRKSRSQAEQHGLFRNAPRALRTEVTRYLRERERDAEWFDSSVLAARKALKRLYALLHVAPGARAQAILFDGRPPADSRLAALRLLDQAATPEEQARLIVEQRLPYRVAVAAVPRPAPVVLRALVETMSPQELINNLAALKRRGALDDAATKALVERKLAEAKGDERVSAYKAQVAAEAAGATGELAQALDAVTEARVQARGRIRRPTALLLDKSGSMHVALEVGRQLGAMISAVCDAELYAYVFDSTAHAVKPAGSGLADWERALLQFHAGGSTSCGVALEWMRRQQQRVEQLVLVTDEAENMAPHFADAYEGYCRELNVRPGVVIVRVGEAMDTVEQACKECGVAAHVVTFAGDYYALPNLLPLLTQPAQADLLLEILEFPLPRRKAS